MYLLIKSHGELTSRYKLLALPKLSMKTSYCLTVGGFVVHPLQSATRHNFVLLCVVLVKNDLGFSSFVFSFHFVYFCVQSNNEKMVKGCSRVTKLWELTAPNLQSDCEQTVSSSFARLMTSR